MNIYEPSEADRRRDNQPATKGDVEALRKDVTTDLSVLDDRVDRKFNALENNMTKWKDEILTSEDKVIKKLDQVLTEQQAITINYKRLDQQVENLIDFAEKAAPKLDLEFKKV